MKVSEIKELLTVEEGKTLDIDSVSNKIAQMANGFINSKVKETQEEIKNYQSQLSNSEKDAKNADEYKKKIEELEGKFNSETLKNKFLQSWNDTTDTDIEDALDLYMLRSGKEGVDTEELFNTITQKYKPNKNNIEVKEPDAFNVPDADTQNISSNDKMESVTKYVDELLKN